MTRLLPLLALVLAGCAAGEPAPSLIAQAPCLDASELEMRTAAQGKELVATGTTSRGMKREVYADPDGNWIEFLTLGPCTKPTQSGTGWQAVVTGVGA